MGKVFVISLRSGDDHSRTTNVASAPASVFRQAKSSGNGFTVEQADRQAMTSSGVVSGVVSVAIQRSNSPWLQAGIRPWIERRLRSQRS